MMLSENNKVLGLNIDRPDAKTYTIKFFFLERGLFYNTVSKYRKKVKLSL
jgi:hypothetical protein